MIDLATKGKLRNLLAQGKKIQAIQLIMELYQVRLAEAKKLLESLELELGIKNSTFSISIDRVICLIMIMIAIPLISMAVFLYWKDVHDTRDAVAITGRVVDFKKDGGSSSPIIEFSYQGQTKFYTSSIYSSPPAFALNEEVRLLLDSHDPDVITIDTFSERYLVILILGVTGVVFGGFVLLFTLFDRKKF